MVVRVGGGAPISFFRSIVMRIIYLDDYWRGHPLTDRTGESEAAPAIADLLRHSEIARAPYGGCKAVRQLDRK
jgi:hypothetical protein